MGKYKDRKKSDAKPQLIRFIPGEHHKDRHARRLNLNLSGEAIVRAWADENGLSLRIKNDGHHWIFERPSLFAEWWPSSAKLVFDHRYQKGIHVHDWTQAQAEIVKKLAVLKIYDVQLPLPPGAKVTTGSFRAKTPEEALGKLATSLVNGEVGDAS